MWELFMEVAFLLYNIRTFGRSFSIVTKKMRLSTSSAALCYYFTMTFFPLIICLYTMLGSSFDTALRIMRFADGVFAEETLTLLEDFLNYVAANNDQTMLVAGLVVLMSFASASIRSMQTTIGHAQGGRRFQGFTHFLFSLVFSLAFLAALYFAMLIMLTGKEFINLAAGFLPALDLGGAWFYLRLPVLAAIYLIIVWAVYEMPKRPKDDYNTLPGAALCTAALVGDSAIFSSFISRSSRYPLVYGSLASIILLMVWLYSCCVVIYIGAAFNITLKELEIKGQ